MAGLTMKADDGQHARRSGVKEAIMFMLILNFYFSHKAA
jgi:hypothetical protein